MKNYNLGRHVFGLLVWLPAPLADPHKLINRAGNAQNPAITGAGWIVADYPPSKALHGKCLPHWDTLTKKDDTDRESRFILPR